VTAELESVRRSGIRRVLGGWRSGR
jgi:hypothetical protein